MRDRYQGVISPGLPARGLEGDHGEGSTVLDPDYPLSAAGRRDDYNSEETKGTRLQMVRRRAFASVCIPLCVCTYGVNYVGYISFKIIISVWIGQICYTMQI